jgi:hypothetical protein
MHSRRRVTMYALIVTALAMVWGLWAVFTVQFGSLAIAATARPASGTQPVCGMAQRAVTQASGSVWVLSRPNPFGLPAAQAARFCVQPAAGPGFTIQNNVPFDGAVRAFPFTGLGCAYSLCSRSTGLPKQVRALPRGADMSWDWRGSPPGEYNAALDLWFGKTAQITSQDTGAELMVWLHTPAGYGPGVHFQWVKIGHRHYWFTYWRAHHGALSWWYIQFRLPSTTHGVHQLWMRPFIRYAEARGLLQPSWWLTSVHAGYELWSGGRGLETTWFNAHV